MSGPLGALVAAAAEDMAYHCVDCLGGDEFGSVEEWAAVLGARVEEAWGREGAAEAGRLRAERDAVRDARVRAETLKSEIDAALAEDSISVVHVVDLLRRASLALAEVERLRVERDDLRERLRNQIDACCGRAERDRTLEDVVTRLEGFQVDPAVVQHFRSLADNREGED